MAGRYVLSGASTVIENLADQLGKKGLEVTIGALSFKRTPPNGHYNVKTINLHNISKLKRFLNSFDILHNHHPLTNYLALFSHKPFIYHYLGAPDFGKGNIFRISMLISINIMKHAFDAVISVSESGARELKRYFGLNDIDVIYNGVDNDHFNPSLDEKFREGKPQFIFVGNLYEHKKVDELVAAFKEVIEVYPKAHLQIVGGGYSYTILNNLIRKLHLQDYVTLVGPVSPYYMPYYYSSCDVYVTASRKEACPLPPIEAMAHGKPIVATSIPSHMELLTKSKAGVNYNSGNIDDLSKKMIKIYEKRDMYKNNALHFAKEHDWSRVADRILRIYSQLIHNRARATSCPI